MSLIEKIKQVAGRYANGSAARKIHETARQVLEERAYFLNWTEYELSSAVLVLRSELRHGASFESLVAPALAAACEAAFRVFGREPGEADIVAALAICHGKLAEDRAGTDRTIVMALASYVYAVQNKGVHVIWESGQAAEQSARKTFTLYQVLGVSAGLVVKGLDSSRRRQAYACDITYTTAEEAVFDYLNDHIIYEKHNRVLRSGDQLPVAIIDGAGQVLIGQAHKLHVLAEPLNRRLDGYYQLAKVARRLKEDADFQADHLNRSVFLTQEGLNRAERLLGGELFYKGNPLNIFLLDACLSARVLFERDRDYLVTKNGVEFADEFTGRPLPGRRFSYAVHRAILAQEGLGEEGADRVIAAVTFQDLFSFYEKLSGIGKNLSPYREELKVVYNLEVENVGPPGSRAAKFKELVNRQAARIHRHKFNLITKSQLEEVYKIRDCLLEDEYEAYRFLESCVENLTRYIFGLNHTELIAKELRQVFAVEVEAIELANLIGHSNNNDDRSAALKDVSDRFLAYFLKILTNMRDNSNSLQAIQQLALQLIDSQWADYRSNIEVLKEGVSRLPHASEILLQDFANDSKHLYADMYVELQKQLVRSVCLSLRQQGVL